MRFSLHALAAILLSIAAAPAAMPVFAQAPQQAPAPAPAKPYKPVAVALPRPLGEPGFDAFRKQLANAAQKQDRAALAKLVVA